MSRVSVLIPNYNGVQWLETTIQSCLQQKDLLEVIIVDDNSTDDSLKALKQLESNHPGIVKVFGNPEKGGNNARNLAYRFSNGKFIQWLDADDQLKERKFEAQLRLLDDHADLDIAYSDWVLHTYDNNILTRQEVKKNKAADDFLAGLLMNNWSPPNAYLLRRSAAEKLHKIKAWNPDTRVLQDREYFTIAAILGCKFGYTPGIYAIYNRWNRNSVSAAKRNLRYAATEDLLNRFEDLLNRENQDARKKEQYLSMIQTERILLRALGYPAKVRQAIKWGEVKWPMIKGLRTNLKFLWQNLKLQAGKIQEA